MKVEKLAKNWQMVQNSQPLSPGMLLAIVATGDAAVTSCTGAAGKFNSENNPGGTGVVARKFVLGYTAASAIVLEDVTLDCTKCAAGYYLSAADSTTGGAVCTQIPAGKYGAATLQSLTDVAVGSVEVLTSCPTNSESVAGSTISNLGDCKVKAGFYIATESIGRLVLSVVRPPDLCIFLL